MTPLNTSSPASPASPATAPHPLRFLIAGGTGFLGTALGRHWLAQGHHVTLLARNPPKVKALFGDQVTLVTFWDQLDPGLAFDVVVNFSGAPILGPRWTEGRKTVLQATRGGVTQALVDWVRSAHHKPGLLLCASAIGYYGVQALDDPRPLSESAPPQPLFMSTLCQAWERTAQAAEELGLQVARLRLGVVMGKGGGALPPMLTPFRLGVGTVMGDGRQVLSWIHLADVLGGVDHILSRWARGGAASAGGAYNFTAPQPLTQREFTRTAQRVVSPRWGLPFALPVPAWTLKAMLGEQAALLTQGQRVVPTRLLVEGYRFQFESFEAALRDIEGP